jgi:hypothetical protein
MKTTERIINYAKSELIRHIIVEDNDYWAIDVNKNLIFNDEAVAKIDNQITLGFSFFYRFGESEFLIIDGNIQNQNNAWIISVNGEIQNSFYVGMGVFKVHIQHNKIIIGNSECTLGCSCPISDNRLVIFDREGNILKTYLYFCTQVEAICYKSETEIYIQGWWDEKLFRIDLETYEIHTYEPELERYADILTYNNGFLYIGYSDEFPKTKLELQNGKIEIYRYQLSDKHNLLPNREYLGQIPYIRYRVQTLKNGRLLFTDVLGEMRADGQKSYWIVDLKSEV